MSGTVPHPTVLDGIVADLRHARPAGRLRPAGLRADAARRDRFVDALRAPELSVIAELKRRSPSAGAIATGDDLPARAAAYSRGGAAVLSVLTEERHFGGSADDLRAVGSTGVPRLRKDFLLELVDVDESHALGADAVLLIAAILDDGRLADLRARAAELGLAVLLEVHDERELERALAVEPDALGVNARDLRSFEVDLATVERLLPQVPDGILRVAESGIRRLEDAARVRAVGADAVLVGEALMRAVDPARFVAELREVTP